MRFLLGIRKEGKERKSIHSYLGEKEEEKESKGGTKEVKANREGLNQLGGEASMADCGHKSQCSDNH